MAAFPGSSLVVPFDSSIAFPYFDSSITLPYFDSSVILPTFNSSMMLSSFNSSSTFSSFNSSSTFTSFDSSIIVGSSVSFPSFDSSITFTSLHSTIAFPSFDSPITFPALNSSITFPSLNSFTDFPSFDSSISLPSFDSSIDFPSFDSSITFPSFSNFNYYLQRRPWYTFDDDFMMYNFKVKRCLNRRAHDWAFCPDVHLGEWLQRRDPCKYKYKRQMCRESDDLTRCTKGRKCKYSHGLYEYWLHPTRYRTRMCNKGLLCRRPVCFFAHDNDQLRLVLLKRGYDACRRGGPISLLRDDHLRHTFLDREVGETSGVFSRTNLNEESDLHQAPIMNAQMDTVMKLLEELELV